MAIEKKQANAQIRRITPTQGGGMGIYATEVLWHGQEVMLVNQEQTKEPEDTSRPRLAEESELCHEWIEEGNPQDLGGGIQTAPESPLLWGTQ
jgi:hypothetical protein